MATAPKTYLDIQPVGDISVVSFTINKVIDEQVIEAIGKQLFSLVDDRGINKIVLNFMKVDYLSSFMIGKLVTLNKKVTAAKGKLALCCIDAKIADIFTITGLNKVFKMFKEEHEALQSM
ncbi:MAG TPA: STAS domain-containing protein [Gemmatales bacterium]|nr:STAS domain-containing protein [Gemmatales bacterium]HMP61416.1 STAS domain-containing protein [Gemmatales bacterium]